MYTLSDEVIFQKEREKKLNLKLGQSLELTIILPDCKLLLVGKGASWKKRGKVNQPNTQYWTFYRTNILVSPTNQKNFLKEEKEETVLL